MNISNDQYHATRICKNPAFVRVRRLPDGMNSFVKQVLCLLEKGTTKDDNTCSRKGYVKNSYIKCRHECCQEA